MPASSSGACFIVLLSQWNFTALCWPLIPPFNSNMWSCRYGAWRVNGVLSVARAIGDRKLKQWVIGRPDVAEFELTGSQEYLVLGCDGLWDVLTPEKVRFNHVIAVAQC